MNNLDALRKTFAFAMIGLLWFNAALVAFAGFWLMGGGGWMAALAGAALAGAPRRCGFPIRSAPRPGS